MTIEELIKTQPHSLSRRAYDFAFKVHRGQKRLSGEPYFNHVVGTAQSLLDWRLDEVSIAAGLLHDVVEDSDYTIEDLQKEFGDEVAFLVDGVTKLGRLKYRGAERQVESLRKMILALSQDLRVVLIKLADRLYNMRTLDALPPHKQKRIALETSEIYAPLAYRLGMQRLSGELQDLAFPYLYPQEHTWLREQVKNRYHIREAYLRRIAPKVEEALKEASIDILNIDFRAKRYSSLYKKLLRYEMDVEKIHDLIAFRIVVTSLPDCYNALGIIHQLFPPVPGRIKDYIALPKPNGYQSIHTTVFGPEQRAIEFQIRTQEMHDEAENGIAAHWAYEQTKGTGAYVKRTSSFADMNDITWVHQLRSWQEKFADSEEFIESLKVDFFKDRIFCLTPQGEVVDLPLGSTPVDFAYQIHSEIGNQCVGARVNQKFVPLDYELSSSDVVEIAIQKNKKPSVSWLNFVKTSNARDHIRAVLRSSRSQNGLLRQAARESELRLTVYDRPGLLRDIVETISRSHVNVLSVTTNPISKSRLQLFKIKCNTVNKEKLQKLLLKLKGTKEVKETSYLLS